MCSSFHRGSSQARDSLRATAMAIKRSSRLLVGLVFILCAGMWTTTKSSDFAVQRLPKQSAPHHDPYHDYNEAPGNPFSFEMELPNWLMEALGAGPKTGSDVNNSVLDFSLDYHIFAGAIFGLALFFTGIFG